MKFKQHKLLQVGAIIILCLAAYASIKQVEGFQEPPPISNSPTLVALFEVIRTMPVWYTTERKNAFEALRELALTKGMVPGSPGEFDEKYSKALNDAFLASKALGDKDDITLDKVITGAREFLNNYTAPVTNSATLQALFNVINPVPGPAWYTTARKDALKQLGDLRIKMGGDKPDFNEKYLAVLNKAFTDSKAAGDKDDVTLDKVIKAGTDYLNKFSSSSSSSSSNLPIYIGAGVGGAVLLGGIGYFMFSTAPTS